MKHFAAGSFVVLIVLLPRIASAQVKMNMKQIAEESSTNPELVKTAPHPTPVGRLDQALAARKPNLRWLPGQEQTH